MMSLGRSNEKRRAVTLVELLVVLAIIGILVAILLPAVQHVRESARSITCRSRLKQIGLALHQYESMHRTFPPGAILAGTAANTYTGRTNLDSFAPWTVLLLPVLDSQTRQAEFRFDRSFFGLKDTSAPAFNEEKQLIRCTKWECPSDPNSSGQNANTNYFGVQGGGAMPHVHGGPGFEGRVVYRNGVFHANSAVSFEDIVDGSSQTFAIGESKYLQLRDGGQQAYGYFFGTWASSFWIAGSDDRNRSSVPVTLAAAVLPINGLELNPARDWTVEIQSRTFGSFHPSGAHFLMVDGSVQRFSEEVDLPVYHSLAVRNDGMAGSF